MEVKTKQRLVGILVLLAVLAIFLPVLFHTTRPSVEQQLSIAIPPKPAAPKVALLEKAEPPVNEPAKAIEEPTAQPVKAPAKPAKLNPPVKAAAKQVAVPKERVALKTLLRSPEAWVVQLGTFGNKENADRLIAKLRKKGFDAYTRPITKDQGKRLYRVYVGPEIHLESAQKLRSKLQASYHLNGVVRKYNI